MCDPCAAAYDAHNRRSDGTVEALIAWTARRARGLAVHGRLERALDALRGVAKADDDPPNYQMHSESCRRDPGRCTCHMRAVYAVLHETLK